MPFHTFNAEWLAAGSGCLLALPAFKLKDYACQGAQGFSIPQSLLRPAREHQSI